MSEYERGAPTQRKIWGTRGCLAMGEGANIMEPHVSIAKNGIFLIFLSERTQNNFAETYDSRLCVGRLTFPYTKAHSALRY